MPMIVINERLRIGKRERKRMKKEQKRLAAMEVKQIKVINPPAKSKKAIVEEKKVFKETEETLLQLQKKKPHDMRIHKRLAKIYRDRKMWPEVEEQEEILEMLDRIKRINKR